MVSGSRALALAKQRHVHTDEVCLAQRLVEVHVLDPGFIPANPASIAQIHGLLNGLDVFVILVSRVIAKNIHIEAGALLDQRQPNATRADNGNRLSGYLVSKKRQVW